MSPTSQGVRPGRPEKRRLILDAARRSFLRNGFTDTSVDVIAADAGVSKQTVYNHFGDKETLFRAMVEQARREWAAEAGDDALKNTGDMEHDLRRNARYWTRMFTREDIAALRRLVISEQIRHPALLEIWIGGRTAFESALAEEIRPYVESGVLDISDIELAAHHLTLLTVTEAAVLTSHGLVKLPPEQLDEIADRGVDLWLRAYLKRPGDSGG